MDRINLPNNYTQEDEKLIKLFKEEMDRLNLLYIKAIQENNITKANNLLGKFKLIARTLNAEYGERADIKIPTEYLKGVGYIQGVKVADNLSKAQIDGMLGDLGPIHIEAVNALLDNSKNYVKASLDGVERQALSMVNEFHQAQIREQLARGIMSGESGYTMNQRIKDYLLDNEITVFKDRGGKTWTMDRYVDMLVRTETSIANTQGTINKALEIGVTKFRIVEHSDCCKLCAEMNGKIVDIRDGVVDLPPFHPNCRGYIYAVVDEELEEQEDNKEEKKIEITTNNKAKTPEERVNKALDIIENSTMYLEHEQGAVVTMDGTIRRIASGLSSSVCLPRYDIREPFIFTHNHPNSSSFSNADFKNWINSEYQQGLRASSKIGTYSITAEHTVDKVLFYKKYQALERSARRLGKADMKTIATSRRSGSTNDFIEKIDGTVIYYKDSPQEFDKIIDEHYWKYYRKAIEQASEDTPGVKFEFIENDGIQKDTELNNMYLEKIKEAGKLRKKEGILYINGNDIHINDHI